MNRNVIAHTPEQLAEHIERGGPMPPWPLLEDPRGAPLAIELAALAWALRAAAIVGVVLLARWSLA